MRQKRAAWAWGGTHLPLSRLHHPVHLVPAHRHVLVQLRQQCAELHPRQRTYTRAGLWSFPAPFSLIWRITNESLRGRMKMTVPLSSKRAVLVRPLQHVLPAEERLPHREGLQHERGQWRQ